MAPLTVGPMTFRLGAASFGQHGMSGFPSFGCFLTEFSFADFLPNFINERWLNYWWLNFINDRCGGAPIPLANRSDPAMVRHCRLAADQTVSSLRPPRRLAKAIRLHAAALPAQLHSLVALAPTAERFAVGITDGAELPGADPGHRRPTLLRLRASDCGEQYSLPVGLGGSVASVAQSQVAVLVGTWWRVERPQLGHVLPAVKEVGILYRVILPREPTDAFTPFRPRPPLLAWKGADLVGPHRHPSRPSKVGHAIPEFPGWFLARESSVGSCSCGACCRSGCSRRLPRDAGCTWPLPSGAYPR